MDISKVDQRVFAERGYTFHHILGEGTYAKVWLVNYSRIDDDNITRDYSLACKVIDNEKAPRSFTRKFLPREIDILSKIRHPHLIHLHGVYEWKTKIFIFMRYAEKGDLLDYILINGEIKENKAKLWTHQLSLGLEYLHELDIVHRDIKCENVLITINNNVKLADFGFSRFIIDSSGRRYLSNTYCGSIAYAAPELLKGKPYDPKCSDIWSLGIVLYVMLNQCLPFNDADLKKLYQYQMGCKWSFRKKIVSRLSEDVKALVHGMLQPDIATRFLIKDVVNSTWFLADNRLKTMAGREWEALEIGKRNKLEMIPKAQKFSIQFWKKSKKDEQIVRITSLRIEQSSDQFNLDVSSSKTEDVNLTENVEITSKIKSKDDMKEEVYKTKSTTMERPVGASPNPEQSADDFSHPEQKRKQSPVIQNFGETQVDDMQKKHSIYGAGKQKATTSTVSITHLGSALSRTEKFISVIETPAAITYSGATLSEKPFTAIKEVSSLTAKPSNIVLFTDQTTFEEETEEDTTTRVQSTSESKEKTDKKSTKPSQPDSEAKD